jgi:hypothetical protein
MRKVFLLLFLQKKKDLALFFASVAQTHPQIIRVDLHFHQQFLRLGLAIVLQMGAQLGHFAFNDGKQMRVIIHVMLLACM